MTIAGLLKQQDQRYASAHFGEWHMNGGSPSRHGYDHHNGATINAEGRVGEPDAYFDQVGLKRPVLNSNFNPDQGLKPFVPSS